MRPTDESAEAIWGSSTDQQHQRDHHRHQVVEQHEHGAQLDGAVDHQVAADPQRTGEAQVHHQQQGRVEQGRGPLGVGGRRLQVAVVVVEALVLVIAAHECLHHPDAGHVLLKHLVEAVEAGQHRAIQRGAVPLVEGQHPDHHRQEDQHDHGQAGLDGQQDEDGAHDHERRPQQRRHAAGDHRADLVTSVVNRTSRSLVSNRSMLPQDRSVTRR
jgi:hypothetical protein